MKGKRSPMMIFTLAVEGLFLTGFLLLVAFGAGIYREAVEVQAENSRARALLSYFSARAKSADEAGCVRLYEEPAGQVLSFEDADSGYAVRVYQQSGKLLEDYGPEDSALAPAAATVIGETQVFQVQREDRTYTITTDAGTMCFTLKAGAEYER